MAGVDDSSGDGEEPQAELFGFPLAGRRTLVPDEGMHPGEQSSCEGSDFESDLVLREPVEGEAPHPGILDDADVVLGTCAFVRAEPRGPAAIHTAARAETRRIRIDGSTGYISARTTARSAAQSPRRCFRGQADQHLARIVDRSQ